MIIIYKICWKVENGKTQYGTCKKNLKKLKCLKEEYSNCHEPLS